MCCNSAPLKYIEILKKFQLFIAHEIKLAYDWNIFKIQGRPHSVSHFEFQKYGQKFDISDPKNLRVRMNFIKIKTLFQCRDHYIGLVILNFEILISDSLSASKKTLG